MTTHGFVSGRSGKKREIGFHCLKYFLDASSFQPWPNRTCIVAADSWIACVAGVERERGRGNLGARESVWGARGGKERNLSFPFPRADCPILVKYQKICEGHLRLSPVAQTDDASGSMYFGGKWGLPEQVQSTVSGDWLLLFLELKVMFMFSRRFVSPYHCFLLEFGHGIYYISYRTDAAHGDRRKTQDGCRQSAQPRLR